VRILALDELTWYRSVMPVTSCYMLFQGRGKAAQWASLAKGSQLILWVVADLVECEITLEDHLATGGGRKIPRGQDRSVVDI